MRDWLRKLRVEKKLSEMDVAREAGISQPFYHTIETGQRSPSIRTAKAIATVFGFDWTRFFENTFEERVS